MVSLIALLLTAAPRTFDWPAVVVEFPALKAYAPVAGDASKAAFAKIGGKCRRVEEKMKLGEGSKEGHVWRWSASIKASGAAVTIEPPAAEHGFDRPDDTRTFPRKAKATLYAAGPWEGDVLPLYAKSYGIEIACWGIDEPSMTCEGKRKSCKRCTVLRLMGAPRGAQRVYGDGVIRADLTRDCEHLCDGVGLSWADFEALAAAAKRARLIDREDEVLARLYRTEAACTEGTFDFAPDFKGGEPQAR